MKQLVSTAVQNMNWHLCSQMPPVTLMVATASWRETCSHLHNRAAATDMSVSGNITYILDCFHLTGSEPNGRKFHICLPKSLSFPCYYFNKKSNSPTCDLTLRILLAEEQNLGISVI